MVTSRLRRLVWSASIFAAACSSSTGPSNLEKSVVGVYQLQTVRGTTLPVSLFGQCTLGAAQPCSACTAAASSGTLTLKNDLRDFTLLLIATGLCTDPSGRTPALSQSYTITAQGSWSTSGSAGLTFSSNNLNFATAVVSGTTLSASFNWLNADAGGQPAPVTAVFGK